MKTIIKRKIPYNYGGTCKGEILLPDISEIKTAYGNSTKWVIISSAIKKLNPEIDFEYLKPRIESRGLDISQIYLEFEGKKITYDAKLLRDPITLKGDNWQEKSHKWEITINGQIFEFYQGIMYRKLKDSFTLNNVLGVLKISIQQLVSGKYDLDTILRCSYAIKPIIEDVLYALVSDASFSVETFPDFCSNIGYDTDSRKALEIYLACQENGEKLRKTGLNISKLQEAFQDY